MSDQSKIVHMVTSDNKDGMIGTLRGMRSVCDPSSVPEYYEWFHIEDKLEQMMEVEKKQIDEIPEMRQCITYPCEDRYNGLRMIYDNAKQHDNVWQSKRDMLASLMKFAYQGKANPHQVDELVNEIFNLKNS